MEESTNMDDLTILVAEDVGSLQSLIPHRINPPHPNSKKQRKVASEVSWSSLVNNSKHTVLTLYFSFDMYQVAMD